MKSLLRSIAGSVPAKLLLGAHLFLLFTVAGCAPQSAQKTRTHVWEARQESLRAESALQKQPNRSAEPTETSEQILAKLETLRQELAAMQQREDTETVSASANQAEVDLLMSRIEELESQNEELEQALFATEGVVTPDGSGEPVHQSSPLTGLPSDIIPDEYFVQIMGLLPNPEEQERINEAVELLNLGAEPVSLKGWVLRDLVRNEWLLDGVGTLEGGQSKVLRRQSMRMGLNNDGDTVQLVAPNGRIVDTFTYAETVEGMWIRKEIE